MRWRADQRGPQDRPKHLLYRQEATALGAAIRAEELKLMITRVHGEDYGFTASVRCTPRWCVNLYWQTADRSPGARPSG